MNKLDKVLIVDDNANLFNKVLYLEDSAVASKFELRLQRCIDIVDSAPNIGRAWSWLEDRGSYDAIILDLDLGPNQDIYFEDDEDKKAIRSGQFSGYIFYKSIISKNFTEYKDKVLFITAYYSEFKKALDPTEFNILKDKLIDKREVGFEEKLFSLLDQIALKSS